MWATATAGALVSLALFTLAAWGVFKSKSWWERVAVAGAIAGLATLVPYGIAASSTGVSGPGLNSAIHIAGSGAVLAVLLVPALECRVKAWLSGEGRRGQAVNAAASGTIRAFRPHKRRVQSASQRIASCRWARAQGVGWCRCCHGCYRPRPEPTLCSESRFAQVVRLHGAASRVVQAAGRCWAACRSAAVACSALVLMPQSIADSSNPPCHGHDTSPCPFRRGCRSRSLNVLSLRGTRSAAGGR